jgi:NAD(P)-dependent dehydrogenase (short-subunit alcohol dehydrogenase family)
MNMALNMKVRDWRGKSVWLVGASTGIGRATASALHARGAHVIVSARQSDALIGFVRQHPGAVALALDSTDRDAVLKAAQIIFENGPLDHVMYCAGHYQELRATAFDLDEMLRHEQVNYSGALMVLAAVLPHFLERAQSQSGMGRSKESVVSGHVSLVSSVAGFRGLPKGLAYGPTKAALINLAETLYLDLQTSGIGVSLINPGFVHTTLTANNQFKMPGLITPEQAAIDIIRGWERGEFEIHFPKRFTRWMKLLRLLPYRLYFPLVRRLTGL